MMKMRVYKYNESSHTNSVGLHPGNLTPKYDICVKDTCTELIRNYFKYRVAVAVCTHV